MICVAHLFHCTNSLWIPVLFSREHRHLVFHLFTGVYYVGNVIMFPKGLRAFDFLSSRRCTARYCDTEVSPDTSQTHLDKVQK